MGIPSDMRAVQLTAFGGVDGLRLADLPEPAPGPGRVLVDVRRIGVMAGVCLGARSGRRT